MNTTPVDLITDFSGVEQLPDIIDLYNTTYGLGLLRWTYPRNHTLDHYLFYRIVQLLLLEFNRGTPPFA